MFAFFDRFRIFHYADCHPQRLRNAVEIVVTVFHLMQRDSDVYGDTIPIPAREDLEEPARRTLQLCTCTIGNAVTENTAEYRESLMSQWQQAGVPWEPKKPAKRARSEPRQ